MIYDDDMILYKLKKYYNLILILKDFDNTLNGE